MGLQWPRLHDYCFDPQQTSLQSDVLRAAKQYLQQAGNIVEELMRATEIPIDVDVRHSIFDDALRWTGERYECSANFTIRLPDLLEGDRLAAEILRQNGYQAIATPRYLVFETDALYGGEKLNHRNTKRSRVPQTSSKKGTPTGKKGGRKKGRNMVRVHNVW